MKTYEEWFDSLDGDLREIFIKENRARDMYFGWTQCQQYMHQDYMALTEKYADLVERYAALIENRESLVERAPVFVEGIK